MSWKPSLPCVSAVLHVRPREAIRGGVTSVQEYGSDGGGEGDGGRGKGDGGGGDGDSEGGGGEGSGGGAQG